MVGKTQIKREGRGERGGERERERERERDMPIWALPKLSSPSYSGENEGSSSSSSISSSLPPPPPLPPPYSDSTPITQKGSHISS